MRLGGTILQHWRSPEVNTHLHSSTGRRRTSSSSAHTPSPPSSPSPRELLDARRCQGALLGAGATTDRTGGGDGVSTRAVGWRARAAVRRRAQARRTGRAAQQRERPREAWALQCAGAHGPLVGAHGQEGPPSRPAQAQHQPDGRRTASRCTEAETLGCRDSVRTRPTHVDT